MCFLFKKNASKLFPVPEKVVSCPIVWLFNKGPPASSSKKDTASTKGKEKGRKEGLPKSKLNFKNFERSHKSKGLSSSAQIAEY